MDKEQVAGQIETGFGTTSMGSIAGDPTLLVLDSFDQSVAVVDLQRRVVLWTLDVSVGASHGSSVAWVLSVSADGASFAVGTGNTGRSDVVTVWDASSFMPLYSFIDAAQALAVTTNNGLRVYVSNLSGVTTVFDRMTETFGSLPVVATSLELSSQGDVLVSAFAPFGPIQLTSTDEGGEQVTLGEGLASVYEATLSRAEDEVLVAAGDSGLAVYSTASQVEVRATNVGAHLVALGRAPGSDIVGASSSTGEFFSIDSATGAFKRFDLAIENVSKVVVSVVPRGCGVECVGDCDSDGGVSIAELVLGVNLALGTAPPPSCDTLDRDDDGKRTIAELLEAVGNALDGCPVVVGF